MTFAEKWKSLTPREKIDTVEACIKYADNVYKKALKARQKHERGQKQYLD